MKIFLCLMLYVVPIFAQNNKSDSLAKVLLAENKQLYEINLRLAGNDSLFRKLYNSFQRQQETVVVLVEQRDKAFETLTKIMRAISSSPDAMKAIEKSDAEVARLIKQYAEVLKPKEANR